MPRQILPHLERLSRQIDGIISEYCRRLDDDFLFGAGAQIPQVATIFERVGSSPLYFSTEHLSLTELLTLIAYRYGFEAVQVVGYGGYAIVLGHDSTAPTAHQQRRVLRLVPEHHVRDVVAHGDPLHPHNVRLDDTGEPIRDAQQPLLLSDLFLLPRHTTRLAFYQRDGRVVQAGGYPASLHCQLLPEVRAFNSPELDQRMARASGDLLEAALASLGVSVADAHGGNGGALLGPDGQPLVRDGLYIPIVLDYGYYSQIEPQRLAALLLRYGLNREQLTAWWPARIPNDASPAALAHSITTSGLPRKAFGRLLYQLQPTLIDAAVWIEQTMANWRTTKERVYPPLRAQSRLTRLYPSFDEVIFPQRIEEYSFTV